MVLVDLILATLFWAGAVPDGDALYRSDFGADGKKQDLPATWKGSGGRFTVEGDAVHLVSDRQNPVLRLDRTFEGDVTVEARVRDADRCHWTGLVVMDAFRVTVNKQFGTLSVVRSENGRDRTLASVPSYHLYVYDRADFRLAVSAAAGRVRCAIDGKTVIDVAVADAPVSGGLALVGGWGTDVRYSELTVRRGGHLGPPAAPPPSPGSDLIEVRSAAFDRPGAIYDDSERPTLTLTFRNRTKRDVSLRIRLRLVDYWERERASEERVLDMPAIGAVSHTWQPAPPERGCYKVTLEVAEGEGASAWVEDLASFAVVPPPPGPDAASPFGGHFEQVNLADHLATGKRIGAKWVRFHDIIQWTWWLRVEPKRGEFTWSDENVKTVREHGFHILGEFLHTPAWATSAPAGTNLAGSHYAYSVYPPRDMAAFSEYVFRTVDHYKDRITHWEVWNEPHYGGFWKGTPEQYAGLLKAAYEAAKRADPDCVIVGGGGVSLDRLDWVELACRAGLADHLDAFSVHGLAGPTTLDELRRQDADLARLRSLLARDGKPPPIWNSETSFPSTSFLDQYRGPFREPHLRYHFRHAAEDMVRLYASNLAQGVERTFYYFTKRLPEGHYRERPIDLNLLDAGGSLKPKGVAYATAARLLNGAQFKERLILGGPPPVWCGVFQRGDDAVAVYWALAGGAERGRQVRIDGLPAGARLIDVMGNERDVPVALPVSREPRFLVCEHMVPDALAARLLAALGRDTREP